MPQNLINEIINDPHLDQLRPTVVTQTNVNYQPDAHPMLSQETMQNLKVETNEREQVNMDDQPTEATNPAENQNNPDAINVIQVEIHRENTVEQNHTPEDSEITLQEEDQILNTQEQAEPAQETNHPETPEDILKSPQKEKSPGQTLEKNA